MDFWKASTLILAAALVIVVGDGVVAANEAEAKGANQQAVQALGLIEAARAHLWRAPRDQDGHRAKALQAARNAVMEVRVLAFGEEGAKNYK
jgi:hypothetical protein